MKEALYARVSKALDQHPENQLLELRAWATKTGYVVEGEYVDEISSKDTRPMKELVLKKMRLNEIDGVAFVALDRWGRTMSELVLELEEFSRTGKSLISLKEGLDLSTAAGRLMANVLAAMANFERDRIKERTIMGLARAKAQGKRLGRPRKETPPENPDAFLEDSIAKLKNVRFSTTDEAMYAHPKEWGYLRNKYMILSKYTCRTCKAVYGCDFLDLDHIISIADGGLAFDESNLQVLCRNCHNSKSSKEAHIRNTGQSKTV
jgi:DNA invertase Pin-like site-specific DNA recombinase